jgi:predicted ester cyclase
MFNKEKRQEKRQKQKEVDAKLKEEIVPRDPFEVRQTKTKRKEKREAEAAEREGRVAERLMALHAGNSAADVVQLGSDLLYLEALSNIQLQIHEQQSRSEKCFTRWMVYGRHDKEFLGMAPTNRDVQFGGVSISFLTADRITQEMHYWDMVALLQQIQAPSP